MKRLFSVSSTVSVIESSRSSDRWLLRFILLAVVATVIWFAIALNSNFSETDIRSGGSITEGIVGTPRFVNPVLALTRADQDITSLIYSGLVKIDETGQLTPDLAESWTMSTDETVYTFTLRNDATFHDGTPVTATDVVFTISLAQDNDLKSSLRGTWNEVSAVAIDDYTVEITLEEPYAPFLANLTLGILPAHIWRSIPIEQVPFSTFNTTPIGSGPYKVTDTKFSENGTVSEYQLKPYEGHSPTAMLSGITVKFYTDEDMLVEAWNKEHITSSAYLPAEFVSEIAESDQFTVTSTPLTRTFGLFFNQNKSVALRDAAVREALELIIDREAIISSSLSGAGIPSSQAINLSSPELKLDDAHAEFETSSPTDTLELAKNVLEEAGWNEDDERGVWEKEINDELVPLQVTIRTSNTPIFKATLEAVTESWESLGVTVVTDQFTQSDLVQTVIRERDFEVLLFGIDPGRTQDAFPFWHSSQQNDPGLNVAQYTNLTVDESLELLRTTSDTEERSGAIATVNTIIQEERPAIFLFQPTVQYVTPAALQQPATTQFNHPSDRFSTVTSWYTEQQQLWPIFTKNNQDESEQNEQTLNTEE